MKCAHAYRFKGSLYLRPFSQTTAGVWVGTDSVARLDENAPAFEKGQAVLDALDGSKQSIPHPTHWDNVDEDVLLRLARVRSWSTFMRTAHSLGIELEGEVLRIVPERNLGPREGFERILDKFVELSIHSTQRDVGDALDTAWRLCE